MSTLMTKDEIELLIIGNYPDQRDYWLNNQASASHTPISLTALCSRCRYESSVTIKNRDEVAQVLKLECPRCQIREQHGDGHLSIPMPFGKYRGRTVNDVMEKDPSYLAWCARNIRDMPDFVEQIKSHSHFPNAWAAYMSKEAAREPPPRRRR